MEINDHFAVRPQCGICNWPVSIADQVYLREFVRSKAMYLRLIHLEIKLLEIASRQVSLDILVYSHSPRMVICVPPRARAYIYVANRAAVPALGPRKLQLCILTVST